jgi:hypothetical protein
MKRLVQPELLDVLSPDDPRARRSRRDLCRVNWWMGNSTILVDSLRKHIGGRVPGRIIEIGAGDGNFLLSVAKKMASRWPEMNVTLLDQQKIVSSETLAAFLKLGWQPEMVMADVFDWPPTDPANRAVDQAPDQVTDQVMVANLFLHHFVEARLTELLQKISYSTKLFIAVEPRRSAWPALGGLLLGLIGCNDVTRHDATVSIRAGFVGQEISALWPDQKNWHLTEQSAGLFSHLFIARRLE